MNIKSFSKIAAVSAIAMVTALTATDVISAPYIIGTDAPIGFTATVDNSIDVAITNGNFGTISAHRATDIATVTLTADAAAEVVDDHSTGLGTATQAHIVGDDSSTPAAATVAITSAFPTEEMFITFSDCVDLTNGTDTFDLVSITDGTVTHSCSDAISAPIAVTSDNAGAVTTFYVGATIATLPGALGPYSEGAYTGSVQMQVIY
jgi:hypothetical protein